MEGVYPKQNGTHVCWTTTVKLVLITNLPFGFGEILLHVRGDTVGDILFLSSITTNPVEKKINTYERQGVVKWGAKKKEQSWQGGGGGGATSVMGKWHCTDASQSVPEIRQRLTCH